MRGADVKYAAVILACVILLQHAREDTADHLRQQSECSSNGPSTPSVLQNNQSVPQTTFSSEPVYVEDSRERALEFDTAMAPAIAERTPVDSRIASMNPPDAGEMAFTTVTNNEGSADVETFDLTNLDVR